LFAEALNRMAVAAREVPDVAGIEIVGLSVPLRVDDGSAAAPLDDEGPLGGRCVPVQLANAAWFEAHRHAGDALGDGQLLDRRLARRVAANNLPVRLFQGEAERR